MDIPGKICTVGVCWLLCVVVAGIIDFGLMAAGFISFSLPPPWLICSGLIGVVIGVLGMISGMLKDTFT